METFNTNLPYASGSSQINVGSTERMVSVFAGSFLLTRGLKNIFRSPTLAVAATIAGGAMLYRGITGYCPVNNAIGRDSSEQPAPLVIKETITVNRPRMEVFAAWDALENLPSFMHHLESVERLSETRSRWVAKALPKFGKIDWYAETTAREEGILLSWRSEPGSKVDNAGEVYFSDSPRNIGTEIHATISYFAPAGEAGRIIAQLFNNVFEQMVYDDLRRFKSMMEAENYIPNTTDSLPSVRTDNPVNL